MAFDKPKKKSKFRKCKCGNETMLAICNQCRSRLQNIKIKEEDEG